MLIYEVNLYVDSEAAEEMALWLKDHIRDRKIIRHFGPHAALFMAPCQI